MELCCCTETLCGWMLDLFISPTFVTVSHLFLSYCSIHSWFQVLMQGTVRNDGMLSVHEQTFFLFDSHRLWDLSGTALTLIPQLNPRTVCKECVILSSFSLPADVFSRCQHGEDTSSSSTSFLCMCLCCCWCNATAGGSTSVSRTHSTPTLWPAVWNTWNTVSEVESGLVCGCSLWSEGVFAAYAALCAFSNAIARAFDPESSCSAPPRSC